MTPLPAGDCFSRQQKQSLNEGFTGCGRVVSRVEAVASWAEPGLFVTKSGTYIARCDKAVSPLPGGRLIHHWQGSGRNRLCAISPDGKYLSFVRGNNLWISTIDGRNQHAVTSAEDSNTLAGAVDPLYGYEFNAGTHYWWAPNAASIAYIETAFHSPDHYPVSGAELPAFRLKLWDAATGATRTVATSSEEWPYLLRVAWHPDGRHLAAYRMNRAQTAAKLVLFDTGDTAGEQTIVTEKDGYWVNAPDTPVFLRGGRMLAVTSERSGRRHVYLYYLNGSLIRDLTPADLEVYRLHAAVDPAGAVFVSAGAGDMLQQNLYRIDAETATATRVTREAGWHGAAAAQAELAPPAENMTGVANRPLSVTTHSGIPLPARLFTPEGFDTKRRYPLIVYTSSGPQGRVAQDAWGGWQMAWNRFMVGQGYLVLAVDARGSAGYGHLFEESLHHRLGAQETSDLREVIAYLRQQPYVDMRRLGIWGCDYGGHTAVHAMMEIPGGFRAGVADSPVLDWRRYDAYFTERYLAMPQTHIADYDSSSPLDSAFRMSGELLVVSSPGNPIVRSSQQAALEETLSHARNRNISGHVHRMSLPDPDYRWSKQLAVLLSAMTAFFEDALGKQVY